MWFSTSASCNNSNYFVFYFKNFYTVLRVPPIYWSIVYTRMKTTEVNNLQCSLWHEGLDWSHCIRSRTEYVCNLFNMNPCDSVLSTYIRIKYVLYSWEINLLAYLMSRSISGLFFGVNHKNWILSKFTVSLFAMIHLFKDLN